MVELRKMGEAYYNNIYREYCLKELTRQCVENGIWGEGEARNKAIHEQDAVLSHGAYTPDNYLFIIHDVAAGMDIGELWFGALPLQKEELCFLFDLHIDEKFQNRGYGYEAMMALEIEASNYNFKKIRLNVFKKNLYAIKLYQKSGYISFAEKENNQWMEKTIRR